MRVQRRTVLGMGLAALMAARAGAQSAVPVIAAASDLQFVLANIAAAFRADTGKDVSLSFGSTGNFARQIRQNAPFDMFMAADEDFVLELAREGFTTDQGVLYGIGRIALIVPNGSPLRPDGSLDDLAAGLLDGRVTHFAIANPDHAPYGARAREALQHRGLWDAIQPALVFGENVSQAAQFATSGNAQGGIIAQSLALSAKVQALGASALIPADWHTPLRQRMALINGAGPVAQAFYAYLQGPVARGAFNRAGFTLPMSG